MRNGNGRHILHSKYLYYKLADSRSFLTGGEMLRYAGLLVHVLEGGSLSGVHSTMSADAERLQRKGMLQIGMNKAVSFHSPLHLQYYLVELYQSQVMRVTDCSKCFESFLKQSIMRMSASRLRNSLSTGSDGRVYERMYQMEWYRSAVSYLPPTAYVSPDVGQVGSACNSS
jgi:hypothetical protein